MKSRVISKDDSGGINMKEGSGASRRGAEPQHECNWWNGQNMKGEAEPQDVSVNRLVQ